MFARSFPWVVCFLLASLANPGAAAAYDCNPERDMDAGRAAFISALSAVDQGRWSDAISGLESAYRLACAPTALFNLAGTLRSVGRHREARDAYRTLLDRHGSELPEEMRTEATENFRGESARVAVLELMGLGDHRPSIRFDGVVVEDDGRRPLVVETNAGNHTLVAEIPDHRPFLWEGRLTDGQRERVEISFAPLPSGEGVDLGLIFGIALPVVAVVAGIIVGVLVYEGAQLQPLSPERSVRIDR